MRKKQTIKSVNPSKRKKKVITMFSVVFAFIFGCAGLGIANGVGFTGAFYGIENNAVSCEEAEKIALLFATMDRKTAIEDGQEEKNTFDENLSVKNVSELYDFDDEVSSYLVEFINENGKDAGYVVVGGSDYYPPIVEFGVTGQSFFRKSLEKVKEKSDSFDKDDDLQDVLLYYTGEYNYFMTSKDESEDMYALSLDYNTADKFNIQDESDYLLGLSSNKDDMREENSSLWKQINREYNMNKDLFSDYESFYDNNYDDYFNNGRNQEIKKGDNITSHVYYGNCSTPSGVKIEDPGNYESGYVTYSIENVNSYWLSYFSVDDISGGLPNACTPCAATNLMYYWYNRSNQCKKFYIDNSWKKTYNSLYRKMGTSDSSTTLSGALNGIKSFCSEYAYGVAADTIKNPDFSDIKDEVSRNYPFLIFTNEHLFYSNHTAFCVGYREYTYKPIVGSLLYSRYLRVADGIAEGCNRYIHTKKGFCKDGYLTMMRCRVGH